MAHQHEGHDVVVVGAGVIGLACAWRCAQRGLEVLVLERAPSPGAGASGVAAGMLAPVTEVEFGEEALLELNLASAALWPGFAAELSERSGLDTGYRASGALVAAADRDDAEELRRLFAFQQSLGLDVRWLGGRECRRLEPRLSPFSTTFTPPPSSLRIGSGQTARPSRAARRRRPWPPRPAR